MKIDDKDIVAAIRQGDKTGYTKLFDSHNKKVFNFIHKKIYDYHNAEDLTMVTFEKAFKKLHTWKPDYKFSTWLFQIAKYTVIDFIKAQAIRINGTDEIDKFLFIKDKSNTPYQILLQNELHALIEGRIERLPKKSKPVMKLHIQGYSDEEIVEKLNIIHGNVRCILSRAKKKFKEEFKQLLYEEDNIIRHSIVA
jgi:RNA polymerase sigma-70 factor (ECF subfamily)